MLRLDELSIHLAFDEETARLPPNKMTFLDALYVDTKTEDVAVPIHGRLVAAKRLTLTIHPKQAVHIQELALYIPLDYSTVERLFCNGLLSTSFSGEYPPSGKMPRFGENYKLLTRYDESGLLRRSQQRPSSWSYSYLRNKNGKVTFMGSLNEQTAFTLFQHRTKTNELAIIADCGHLQLDHSFPVLDLFFADGRELDIFDSYFALMNCPPVTAKPLLAWQYSTPSAGLEKLDTTLQHLQQQEAGLDLVWLGSNFAKAKGDWLNANVSVPEVVQRIHQQGYQAGLALSPLACSPQSEVFNKHSDWLLRDSQGKPVQANTTALGGESLYALDIFKQEVQDYLSTIFYTFFQKWQVDVLRLESLYQTCLVPPPGKTRAQMMQKALELFQNLAGDKHLWMDEVPLGAAFGQATYCGVTPLILQKPATFWDRFFGRKRSSTFDTMETLIGRWQLNGRAFQSAGSRFTLRQNHPFLDESQQHAILLVQVLMSNLYSTSDTTEHYRPETWGEWHCIHRWSASEITKVDYFSTHTFGIHFRQEEETYIAICNLQSKAHDFSYMEQLIPLDPYEVVILRMPQEKI